MSSIQLKMTTDQSEEVKVNLPPPRIWKPEHLADFFGFSVHWVYKQTRKDSPDPIPRCKGMRHIRFDTSDPKFQAWLARQIES